MYDWWSIPGPSPEPRMTITTDPWPAPAKLNLFLHIVGRRADGYHLLQTVFQFLDGGDHIRNTPRADNRIRRLTPIASVAEDDDLSIRAARALQIAAGVDGGADFAVDMLLPLVSGLGGGSSDAATVLVALNHLWSAGLSEDVLALLGLTLGADVPVCVRVL